LPPALSGRRRSTWSPRALKGAHRVRRTEDAMAIKVGDRLPEGTLMELGAAGPAPVDVADAPAGPGGDGRKPQ
jgi:hypothetical protein